MPFSRKLSYPRVNIWTIILLHGSSRAFWVIHCHRRWNSVEARKQTEVRWKEAVRAEKSLISVFEYQTQKLLVPSCFLFLFSQDIVEVEFLMKTLREHFSLDTTETSGSSHFAFAFILMSCLHPHKKTAERQSRVRRREKVLSDGFSLSVVLPSSSRHLIHIGDEGKTPAVREQDGIASLSAELLCLRSRLKRENFQG